jgi:hypothetical protein
MPGLDRIVLDTRIYPKRQPQAFAKAFRYAQSEKGKHSHAPTHPRKIVQKDLDFRLPVVFGCLLCLYPAGPSASKNYITYINIIYKVYCTKRTMPRYAHNSF